MLARAQPRLSPLVVFTLLLTVVSCGTSGPTGPGGGGTSGPTGPGGGGTSGPTGPGGTSGRLARFKLSIRSPDYPNDPSHDGLTYDSVPAVLPVQLSLRAIPVDSFGNPVALSSVTWAIDAGGGSLDQATTPLGFGPAGQPTGAVDVWHLGANPGVQRIALRTPDVPSFTQTYSVRALSEQLVFKFVQPPSTLITTVGVMLPGPIVGRLITQAGDPFPGAHLAVGVDKFSSLGRPIPGRFSQPPCTGAAGASTPFPSFVTDANGSISVCFTPDTLEAITQFVFGVVFDANPWSVPASGFDTVSVVVHAGPAVAAGSIAGNGQAGSVGQPLALPLAFRLLDRYGNTVTGQTVVWTVTSGGGSVAAPTTTTNDVGTSNTWTLGPVVGTQTVTATAGAVTVTFTAQAS